MMHLRLLLVLALLAAAPLASAQYKCKDEKGRTQYLSIPRAGCTDMAGKPVEVPKAGSQAKSTPAWAKPAAGEASPARRPAPRQAPVVGALPSDPAQRTVDCRAYQQQLDWLNSPEGRRQENHGARVSQVQQAMRGCT